jgi:hypothetical protein
MTSCGIYKKIEYKEVISIKKDTCVQINNENISNLYFAFSSNKNYRQRGKLKTETYIISYQKDTDSYIKFVRNTKEKRQTFFPRILTIKILETYTNYDNHIDCSLIGYDILTNQIYSISEFINSGRIVYELKNLNCVEEIHYYVIRK